MLAGLAAPVLLSRPTLAADLVKVAVAECWAWDTSVCTFGDRLGFFRKAGLAVLIVIFLLAGLANAGLSRLRLAVTPYLGR